MITLEQADANEDIMLAISEAALSNIHDPRVTITDVYEKDVVNHVISGTIELDGLLYGFVQENGNMNGDLLLEWGLAEDVDEYEKPRRQSGRMSRI